jgi:HAD superfamily hydrolase (TIGR01509 family)
MFPRAVKAVVFDMDGLLIDSENAYRDAMIHVAREQYGRELPVSVFLRMVGLSAPAWQRVAIDHFGEDFPIDTYNAAVWAYAHHKHANGVALKPGVLELLDHLDVNLLPRAVATSSGHQAVKHQLGGNRIYDRFHTIVAAGDYAKGKPAPDPFLTAAARMGVDPKDCLALEDSHNGVRAAHAAGMMTVMVPDLLQPTDEMHERCITIAPDLHHVRELLLKATTSLSSPV